MRDAVTRPPEAEGSGAAAQHEDAHPELTTLPMVCPMAMMPMAHTGLTKNVTTPPER